MLTEDAEANSNNQPDPVILAHLIFELEALVRSQAINFEQLQAILQLIENREEAAFLAFGQDVEEGVTINETANRRLTDAATYAFKNKKKKIRIVRHGRLCSLANRYISHYKARWASEIAARRSPQRLAPVLTLGLARCFHF